MDLLLYIFAQFAASAQDPFLWPAVLCGYASRRHGTMAVLGGASLGFGLAFLSTPMHGRFTLQTDLFWAAGALAGSALACLGLGLAHGKAALLRLCGSGGGFGGLLAFLKKRCPICAERVHAESGQCLYCGYHFVEYEEQ